MVTFTLIFATFLIQGFYEKSYEKVKMVRKKSLPTVKMGWYRLIRRKLSPVRRFVLLALTNHKLVLRNHFTMIKGLAALILLFLYIMISSQIMALGETATENINLFFIISALFIIFITNLSTKVLFRPTENYVYYKLAPLKVWYLIMNLWAVKYIFQFLAGGFFFINLFIFLVLFQASLESIVILLNIMNYQGFLIYFFYILYFVLLLAIVVFLQGYVEELIIWAVNLKNLVVFVIAMTLSERYWERTEV